jgi:hypothetical protein
LLLDGKEKIYSNKRDRAPGTQETAVTMATSKDPNKGEDEENASSEPQQKSLFDFYKRKKRGMPKKFGDRQGGSGPEDAQEAAQACDNMQGSTKGVFRNYCLQIG